VARGELADGVGEIGFRVEAIQLGGLDQGVEDGGAVATWAWFKTGGLWVTPKMARAAPTKELHVSRVTGI